MQSFAESLTPSGRSAAALQSAALVTLGVAVLTLSAKFQVPFWPVPMTLQTLAVVVLGMLAGPRLAAATIGLYIAIGAMGLPVFAGTPQRGVGVAYLLGPTGGYVLGFALAMPLAGWAARHGFDRSTARALLVALAAMLAIYLPGYLWLGAQIGYEKAWVAGVVPFALADGLKILLAGLLVPAIWRMRRGG